MELQQIAERCQQGDREAFALLYTAMHDSLHSVCLRYVKDDTVADDLLHDAFLLIFSKIGHLKDTARAEAWMSMVARRVALLYLRQQKQQRQTPFAETPEAAMPTVENRAEQKLILSEILAAVDALPDGYRRVFRLSVLEGMSHQEIAVLLNIEPHSSSSQLFHAKALLRRWLGPLVLLLIVVALPVALWWLRDSTQEEKTDASVPVISKNGEDTAASTPVTSKNEEATAASALLPSREGTGGGVCNLPEACEQEMKDMAETGIQTPPLTPPLEGRGGAAPDVSISLEGRGMSLLTSTTTAITRTDDAWTVDMAYSGVDNSNSAGQLPFADAETNPVVYDSLATHHFPLTVTLMLSRHLGQHWHAGAGLSYTRLKSDFSIGNTYVSQHQHQTVQYLGLPVSASYHWSLAKRLQVYAKASATLQLPLRSTRDSYYLMPDGHKEESTTEHLHPGLQVSMGIGVGLQYQLVPHVSLFAEPSVQYFFPNGCGVSTWNTGHPFAPSFPFGLKFNF